MSEQSVGTCGRCGGPVTVPSVWMGLLPPTPTCQKCGATMKNSHGPAPVKAGRGGLPKET